MAARRDWRRCHGLILVAVAAVSGCHGDLTAWRTRLQAPEIASLEGAWTIELTSEGVPPPRAVGTLALVVNRAHVRYSWTQSPPVAFGTYDLSVESLGLDTGDESATPTAFVDVQPGQVMLRLGIDAKWPIDMIGRWSGDSLIGRWSVDHRAGTSSAGSFVLRRR